MGEWVCDAGAGVCVWVVFVMRWIGLDWKLELELGVRSLEWDGVWVMRNDLYVPG